MLDARVDLRVLVDVVGLLLSIASHGHSFFYRPKFADFSEISVLSVGPDKNRYRPNFSAFSCSRAYDLKFPLDGPTTLPSPQNPPPKP
jgi:hypothetical protein